MRELAEQARERREVEATEDRRRKEERDAKLRRSQEENAELEERLAKDSAKRSWKASGVRRPRSIGRGRRCGRRC